MKLSNFNAVNIKMGMAFSRDAGLIDLAGSKREIRDLNLQIPALPHIGMHY